MKIDDMCAQILENYISYLVLLWAIKNIFEKYCLNVFDGYGCMPFLNQVNYSKLNEKLYFNWIITNRSYSEKYAYIRKEQISHQMGRKSIFLIWGVVVTGASRTFACQHADVSSSEAKNTASDEESEYITLVKKLRNTWTSCIKK